MWLARRPALIVNELAECFQKMNMFRRAIRWIASPASHPADPYAAQMGFLRAARGDLAASYPRIKPWAILRSFRKFRLRSFPDSFFMEARPSVGFLLLFLASVKPWRVGDWHPLFSGAFYRATNPDLANVRVAPWLHYQVFGRLEGRTPHPLFDPRRLAAALPEVRLADVIDEYLLDPRYWLEETSNYTDLGGYVAAGPWDGVTNPLKQIWAQGTLEPWIHTRLMIVDSHGPLDTSRVLAIAALTLLRGPASRAATFTEWGFDASADLSDLSVPAFTVIPGFFLGASGAVISADMSRKLSNDSTMMRYSGGFVSMDAGDEITADALLYFTGDISREQLEDELDKSLGLTAIAPSSANQEFVFRFLCADRAGVLVLPHGVQVRVVASSAARVIARLGEVHESEWNWLNPGGSHLAIVLDYKHRHRAALDDRVIALIASGAALCIIHNGDLREWVGVFQRSRTFLVDKTVLGLVHGLIPRANIFILPSGEVASRG